MRNEEEHDISYDSDINQINTLFRKGKEDEIEHSESSKYSDDFIVTYGGDESKEFTYAAGIHDKRGGERTQKVETMATTQKKVKTTKKKVAKKTTKKKAPAKKAAPKRRVASRAKKKTRTRSMKPVGTRVKKKSNFWLWALFAIIIICIVLLLFLFVTAPKDGDFMSGLRDMFSKEKPVDNTLATVNGEEITQSEFDSYYKKLPVALRSNMDAATVLDQVIDKTLLLQFAEEKGIGATGEEVDEMINELLAITGLSDADLESYLASQNMTLEEYRVLVKDDIILSKIVNEYIIEQVAVTDDEAMAYYEETKDVLGDMTYEEAKESIVEFLKIQGGRAAFEVLMADLRENAEIVINGEPVDDEDEIEDIKQELTDKYIEKTDEEKLSECLAEKEVMFYTAHWCTQCETQLEDFGDAAVNLNVVECFEDGDKKDVAQECRDAGVTAYPTWKSADVMISGRQPLVKLGRMFGCA